MKKNTRKRYDGLKETVNSNICGDGYNAKGRATEITNKCKILIDDAYDKGYTAAIEKILKEVRDLVNKECNSSCECQPDCLYLEATGDVIQILKKLKENK